MSRGSPRNAIHGAAGLAWLKIDPLLDPLRKEPRFQEIARAQIPGLTQSSGA